MKILELNQDGSLRLDDNGKPISRTVTEGFYYTMLDKYGKHCRWKPEEKKPIKNKINEGK